MRARAAAMTAVVGAVTTWMVTPWVALQLGRSLDDTARARVRAEGRPSRSPAGATVVALPRPRTAGDVVPSPRPAADDGRRVSRVS